MTLDLVPTKTRLPKAASIGNAINDFITIELAGIHPDARSTYRKSLERFLIYTHRRELTPRTIAYYPIWMADNGHGHGVIHKSVLNLRRFLTWCFRMGITDIRWYEYLPRVKSKPPPQPRIITHAEYQKLKDACRNKDQEWLIICSYNTGFRLGDCCTMKWDVIDQKNQVINPILNKTRKSTGLSAKIPYYSGSDIYYKIAEMWANREDVGGDNYVVPGLAWLYNNNRKSIAESMHRLFERAGVHGRSFKHIRCTFESRLANSGMNMVLAAKITGRSDTKSLMRYVVPDMDSAREGIAKAMELHNTNKMFA